jgi:hypothetical protein
MADEVVVPFPTTIAPVRAMRSTQLLSSVETLRETGFFDAYIAKLPADMHDVMLRTVPGVWVPVETALRHFRTCDALDLSPETHFRLGRHTFTRVQGTVLGTLIALAKTAGMTPWTPLARFPRLWSRAYDGGGIRVLRLSQREAQIDIVQSCLLESDYYREGLRGFFSGAGSLFASHVSVREIGASHHAVSLGLQWVGSRGPSPPLT